MIFFQILGLLIMGLSVANAQSCQWPEIPSVLVPVHITGPDEHRVNIVITGNGFLANDPDSLLDDGDNLDSFAVRTESFVDHILETLPAPFSQYRNMMNIYRLDVVSCETADPAPGEPEPITAFGLDIDKNLVESAVEEHVPLWHHIGVYQNNHGGTGGGGELFWAGAGFEGGTSYHIFTHEFGHGFNLLADEYPSARPITGNPPNLTYNQDNPPWRLWVDNFPSIIGVITQGYYTNPISGITLYKYIPTEYCTMQHPDMGFCPICVEQIILDMYENQGLIESFSPTEDTTTLTSGQSVTLSINPLPDPLSHSYEIDWTMNDQDLYIPGQTSFGITALPSQLEYGYHDVTAIVTDPGTGTHQFQGVNVPLLLTPVHQERSWIIVYPNPDAPAAPMGLGAISSLNSEAILWWNAGSDPDHAGYKVYRGVTPIVTDAELVADAGYVGSYTDPVPQVGMTYYYMITAYDSDMNESLFSDTVSVFIKNTTPPTAPGALAGAPTVEEILVTYTYENFSGVYLEWSESPETDVEAYRVYRSYDGVSPFEPIVTLPIASEEQYSYFDYGGLGEDQLENSHPYHYYVTAVNTSGYESAPSAEIVVTVDPNVPPTISEIHILEPRPIYHNDFSTNIWVEAEDPDAPLDYTGFDWQSSIDGSMSSSSGFNIIHLNVGYHFISCRYQDDDGAWSDMVMTPISIVELFRGDFNRDGKLDIADMQNLLDYLFEDGDPPKFLEEGDVNNNGEIEFSDFFYLRDHLFFSGPAPYPATEMTGTLMN